MDISPEISVICTRYAPCGEVREREREPACNIIFIVSFETISRLISRGRAGSVLYNINAWCPLPPHLMQKIRERE